jgi:hypothetical protein
VNSCSHHMQGSREQESYREAKSDNSIGDKVVPGVDPTLSLRGESREQESPTLVDESAREPSKQVLVPAETPSPQPNMRRQAGFLEGEL